MDSMPGVSVVKFAAGFTDAAGVGVAVAVGDGLVQPLNATNSAQIIVIHKSIFAMLLFNWFDPPYWHLTRI
jgi:hypothetical protein